MKIKHYILFTLLGAFLFSSCESDLDVEIRDPNITLGDQIFTSAEAHLRGGGGDLNTALNYVNSLGDSLWRHFRKYCFCSTRS